MVSKNQITTVVEKEEIIYRYVSGKYRESKLVNLDYEILGVINALNSFRLFLNKPFTIETRCEGIVKFCNKSKEKN